MTTLTYYCSADDLRRNLGISSSDLSDNDAIEFIKWAQAEVDDLTHTTFLPVQDSGTATSGDTTTVTDSGATWTADEWNSDANLVGGYAVWIYSGTNNGEVRTITDNSTTALTVSPAFSSAIDNTSKYRIIKNTYVTETWDGDDTDVYFTRNYPLLSVYSITANSVSITVSSIYETDQWGKLQLGRTSEATTFVSTYPRLHNTIYYYGVYPVPVLIKEFTAVLAALSGAMNRIGGTFTIATSYSVPDLSVTKGVPYPHFDRALKALEDKRNYLQKEVLKTYVRSMFA